ncbi:hypothetical protein KGM_210104 [Danaus plexippus plexippus]|uniref:Uncharacterized protein n=1 Tax=Danaus plexippus plexippus TaxID=278856 RepID=A0A212FDJ8_DANPL|nr:hypothetical protein KGM_210104 [Danaus plexippus plexippus]
MASDTDDIEQNIENLKTTVKQSFARIYASLKARELKTLRQLDVIRKQCQDNKDLERNCVQNVQICFSNESSLLQYIANYGVIDFERLNFDSNTFLLEDYVSPNDDHMYSYKTIEEMTKEEDIKQLEAIEEAAIKQITETEDCVCYVNVHSSDVAKKFRDVEPEITISTTSSKNSTENDSELKDDLIADNNAEDDKSESEDSEVKKINPTDEWLNSIKGQTETEPSQVNDVMEHSTIACS